MAESLFSPFWYRVSDLHPRLRGGVRVQRQTYRGEVWYLLIDGASGRQQRINRSAYELIGRFDGRTSVNQAWTLLLEQLGDDAPTQEEVVRIVARLSESELVQLETKPDIEGLFEEARGALAPPPPVGQPARGLAAALRPLAPARAPGARVALAAASGGLRALGRGRAGGSARRRRSLECACRTTRQST